MMMNTNDTSRFSTDAAQAWLKDTPASAQAVFEALATMQLLQEVADNAEATLKVATVLPVDNVQLASNLHALTCDVTTRLVEVSRRQIETLRGMLQV